MLSLARSVRIGIDPNLDRRTLRVWIGGAEIPLTPNLLDAVLALCHGTPGPAQLSILLHHGVVAQHAPDPLPQHTVLARGTTVELRRATRTIPTPHGRVAVRPMLSEAIALFMPPQKLYPLQHLAGRLRSAWEVMCRATNNATQSLDRERITSILEAIAVHEFERRPTLQAVLDIVGTSPLLFAPMEPLQDGENHFPIQAAVIRGDREQPDSTQPDLVVEFHTHDDFLAFRRTFASLSMGTAPKASPLTIGLNAHRLLEKTDSRSLTTPVGTILHLGHAALLANLGATILIDPWLPSSSTTDEIPPPMFRDLGPIEAVFFTHHHWDHVDLQSLLHLAPTTTIYVPLQVKKRALAPRTTELLQSLGFDDVRTLRHGDRVRFPRGSVVAAPFTGEDPSLIHFVGNTYIIEHDRRACLVHVDAGPTNDGTSLFSNGVAADLAKQHGPLSPVFATRRQERATPIEHGWPFLLLPADQWVQPTENCCTGPAFLRDLCSAVGASELVVYAEGGATWFPKDTNFLRTSDDPWMHALTYLWDDLPAIKAAVAEVGATTHLSKAYDRFTIGGPSAAE